MKEKPIQYIDSHVHLDHIFSDNPGRISWFAENGCMPVSWSFCKPVASVADIRRCLDNHKETINELSEIRLPSYYLAGVHPRNITKDLRPERIRELILPYLDDPRCLGIGEIGLESGTIQEVEIFSAHLELAQEVTERGKVFGVHTPREDKLRVAMQSLAIMNRFSGFKKFMVVDHCTPEIIGNVLEAGFRAGITLSPVKASVRDILEITMQYGDMISRIMLNTDSGMHCYDDLYSFVLESEMDPEIKQALTCRNAAFFYKISGVI